MSNLEQQQRHAQLQAQMTVSLNALRAEKLAQMADIVESTKKLPNIPGMQSLPASANDSRFKKDEDASLIMSAAIGIPGVSEVVDTMIDVGEQLYNDHRNTVAATRPQDDEVYSIKEMALINEQRNNDIGLFVSLESELNILDTYIASGYTRGAYSQGTLLPIESGPEQDLTPEDSFIAAHQQEYKMAMPAPKFAA